MVQSDAEGILEVFKEEHLRVKNFYRNMSIIVFLLMIVDLAMVYLFNYRLGNGRMSFYSIIGLGALVISLAFCLNIYNREKRRYNGVCEFKRKYLLPEELRR